MRSVGDAGRQVNQIRGVVHVILIMRDINGSVHVSQIPSGLYTVSELN